MKVIASETGLEAFRTIFQDLLAKGSQLVVWQVTNSGRNIYFGNLQSYNLNDKAFYISLETGEIDSQSIVFFYLESLQIIFKTKLVEFKEGQYRLLFPLEMKEVEKGDADFGASLLAEKENNVWVYSGKRTKEGEEYVQIKSMKERTSRDQEFLNQEFDHVSLDQEDKIYADKRESPRIRPKQEKLVKVVRQGETKIHIMKLFDLSRGGMGFLTVRPEEYPKQSQVYIVGFDTFDLDDPLLGMVMSHRPLDELGVEFKVGVKFDEGQE